MSKYDNQEAFILAAKRVRARITRAKEIGIAGMTPKKLAGLIENFTVAKAIETGKHVDEVRAGQEYYVQTLLDASSQDVNSLIDAEYAQATMELGTEDDIVKSLEELQAA